MGQLSDSIVGTPGETPSIDVSRQKLSNADGSFSTERTIGVEIDGKHRLIPTIVDGRQVLPDEAVSLFRAGKNNAVGTFNTQAEADAYAPKRSLEIGSVRDSFDLGKSILGEPSDAQKIGLALDQDKTPEHSAKILKLQQRTRLPISLIEQNLDMVEKEVARSDFDLDGFTRDNPTVSKWLAENPEHAALARDDMSNLGALEKTINVIGNLGGALRASVPRTAAAEFGALRSISDSFAGFKMFPRSAAKQASAFFAEQQQEQMALADAWRGKQEGAGLVESSIYSGIESIGQNIVGVLATAATKDPRPMLGLMFGQTYGEEYGKARDAGKSLFDSITYAGAQGSVEAATELLPAMRLVKDLGLKTSLVRTFLNQMPSELVGEQIATVVQDFDEWAVLHQDAPFSDYLEQRPTAAAQTLIATLVATGGLVTIAHTTNKVLSYKEAKQQEDFFTALGENATESKTRERLPEKYQEIVERLTKDGPVENVYAPVEFFQKHWEGQGIDPRAVAKELGIEQQYDEALQTGGKVEIPTAIYARRIAPTANNSAFAKELTTSADSLNSRELDEIVATGNVRTDDNADFEVSKQKVFDDVLGQLVGVYPEADARAQATLEAERLAARAKRLGLDPWEAYSGRPAVIQQDIPEALRELGKLDTIDAMLDRLRTDDVPRGTRGPSLVAFLKERGGLQDDGGELSDRDAAKSVRGLVKQGGRTLDDAAEQAVEAGYITERSPDKLLEALDRELRGDPVYAPGKGDATAQETERQLTELSDYLQKYGIDLKALDNEAVKTLLRGSKSIDIDISTTAVEYNVSDNEALYQKDLFGTDVPDGGAKPKRAAKARDVQPAIAVRALEVEDETTGTYAVETALVSERSRSVPFDTITTPDQAAQAFAYLFDYAVEHFDALVTDKNGKPLAIVGSFKGTINGAAVYPSVIAHEAFRVKGAANLWMSHNHPSGTSTLSRADETIHDRIANLFDGTGIKLHGLFAIGNGEYSFRENSGSITDGKIEPSKPDGGVSVPVVERVFKQNKNLGGSIDSTSQAKVVVPSLAADKSGILFLDNKNKPVAFLPISADEAGKFKTEGRVDRVYRAASKANAVSAMIANPNGTFDAFKENNIVAMLKVQDIKSLDVIRYDADAKKATNISSGSQIGTFENTSGMFFQNGAAQYVNFPDTIDIDGKQRPTTNSEGRPIAPTEQGVRNFWKWFGDSKVVDADGKPLVVYHGTDEDITTFDEAQSQNGFWFTGDESDAGDYGGEVASVYLSIKNPSYFERANGDAGLNEAIAAAKAAGHDGMIITAPRDGDASGMYWPKNYVAFRPEQIKSAIGNRGTFSPDSANILYQDQHRGSIVRTPYADIIKLFKSRNLSTLLHEFGHRWLFDLQEDVNHPNAPQELKDDFASALKFLGVESVEQLQPDRFEKGSAEHNRAIAANEKWAQAVEAYLKEGKAPSSALRQVFSKFKAWLIAVYDILKQGRLDVQLNDEIRGVFDRLLATRDEIEAAKSEGRIGEVFSTAVDAGMSETEFAAYRKTIERASQTAQDELERKLMKQFLREHQKWWKEERAKLRTDVESEVDSQKDYKAIALLKSEDGPKLDRTSIQEAIYGGKEMLKRLPKGITTKENGMSPDLAADILGYNSGESLVLALANARNRNELVDAETDRRMHETHGDMMTDGSLPEAARKAVANEERGQIIEVEIKALQKKQREVAPFIKAKEKAEKEQQQAGKKIYGALVTTQKQAHEIAVRTIADLKVRDIKPQRYYTAARQASKRAMDAVGKKDYLMAAYNKSQEMVSLEMYREANKAIDTVESQREYMGKFGKESARKKLRGDALVQIDAVLERFDLRRRSLKAVDAEQETLKDWIEQEADRLSAVVPDLPGFILDGAYRKNYRDMTVEELNGVVDAIKQLEMLARREHDQYMAIRQMNFEQERGSILARIQEFNPKAFDDDGKPKRPEPDFVPTASKAAKKVGDKFTGEFLNAETILNILEGGQFGQVAESLFGRLSSRSNWKATRLEGIYKALNPLFKQYSLKERIAFSRADIGLGLTRENAVVVALLNGNKEGRERLQNYGWNDTYIRQIVDKLDERDWKLVAAVWDMFDNNLWPELKALNERTRGSAPPKVEALAYQTRFGTQVGGYFRLKYDTDLDERAHHLDEAAAVKDMLGGSLGMSSKTNQGSSTKRVQGVKLRPRLDLGVFSEAVNETVHDLAYREAVADTIRLLNDHGIRDAIKASVGIPAYRALILRVREVAAPPRNPSGFIEKTLTIARKNTIVTLLSGVRTALLNLTGMVSIGARVTQGEINGGLILREVAKFYSPRMKEMYQFATENSEYMRHRFKNYDRDLQDMADKLTVNGKVMPDTAAWLWLMGMTDRGVSIPLWNAFYAQGMQKFENDHGKSVEYANHIVRQTQGSGREVDLAKIQSGHGGYGQLKRVFTMFYSYFNAQLGQLVRAGSISAKEAQENRSLAVAKFTASFMFLVVFPAMLNTLGGRDDDDLDELDEKWFKKFAYAITMYGAAMVPVVRDLVSYVWGVFDKDIGNFGFKLSPIQAAGEGVGKGLVSTRDFLIDEADTKDARNMIMGFSYSVGLPGRLMADTVLGTNAFLEGEAGPDAIVFGPDKK